MRKCDEWDLSALQELFFQTINEQKFQQHQSYRCYWRLFKKKQLNKILFSLRFFPIPSYHAYSDSENNEIAIKNSTFIREVLFTRFSKIDKEIINFGTDNSDSFYFLHAMEQGDMAIVFPLSFLLKKSTIIRGIEKYFTFVTYRPNYMKMLLYNDVIYDTLDIITNLRNLPSPRFIFTDKKTYCTYFKGGENFEEKSQKFHNFQRLYVDDNIYIHNISWHFHRNQKMTYIVDCIIKRIFGINAKNNIVNIIFHRALQFDNIEKNIIFHNWQENGTRAKGMQINSHAANISTLIAHCFLIKETSNVSVTTKYYI